jgi:hypothetical protein
MSNSEHAGLYDDTSAPLLMRKREQERFYIYIVLFSLLNCSSRALLGLVIGYCESHDLSQWVILQGLPNPDSTSTYITFSHGMLEWPDSSTITLQI